MSVNGVLEGYLTVYGWDVYAAIFLLLVAVGLVLYPVARVLFDLAITYAEGGSTPEALTIRHHATSPPRSRMIAPTWRGPTPAARPRSPYVATRPGGTRSAASSTR